MNTASSIATLLGFAMLSACGNSPPETTANTAVQIVAPAVDVRTGNVTMPAAATAATTPSAEKAGDLAHCPSTIGAPGAIPAGARRLGNANERDLPLTDASIATIAPADYDPELGNLAESEADEVDGDARIVGASFSYAPSLPAVSLVCRYGKSVLPLSGEAMLLIPLKPKWAQCRFIAATSGAVASMTCRPIRPIK
ncbi:hypothetical protein ACVWZA_003664 [Sphingomonas sp. UYAg733]